MEAHRMKCSSKFCPAPRYQRRKFCYLHESLRLWLAKTEKKQS